MARSNSKRILGIPDEFWIGFVIMCGCFLKLVYDIKLGYANSGTPYLGQWIENITEDAPAGGHIGYIEYLYTFHRLPSVDPTEYATYANPPFYYVISALMMEVMHRLLGWSVGICLHCLQCVNAIYTIVGECCGIGILHMFGVRGRKFIVSILFLLFFPTFYLLAATMDASAMAFMFMMLTLNKALDWYNSRRYTTLRSTAVTLGLGMLTSYTCIMVLPSVVMLMRNAQRDGRRNQTPLSKQFRNFFIIFCIMALVWPVSLSIRFHVPFLYVGTPSGSRISVSLFDRIRIPGAMLLTHIHSTGNSALEYNIWAQTFKTAIVGFDAIDTSMSGTYIITVFAVYLSIVICILAHIMTFYSIFSDRVDRVLGRFLWVGYLWILIGYVVVCIRFPYTGTMEMKKIAPILIFPITGMSICGNGDRSDNAFEKTFTRLINPMIVVLSFITAFLFGFYV